MRAARDNREMLSDKSALHQQNAATTLKVTYTPTEKHCVFRLSDLQICKAFPRYLFKRGIEVVLGLNLKHSLVHINPIRVKAAASDPVIAGLKEL